MEIESPVLQDNFWHWTIFKNTCILDCALAGVSRGTTIPNEPAKIHPFVVGFTEQLREKKNLALQKYLIFSQVWQQTFKRSNFFLNHVAFVRFEWSVGLPVILERVVVVHPCVWLFQAPLPWGFWAAPPWGGYRYNAGIKLQTHVRHLDLLFTAYRKCDIHHNNMMFFSIW